jgi:hypothetical protein
MRYAASAGLGAGLAAIAASVVLAQPTSAPYLWILHALGWVLMVLCIQRWGLPPNAMRMMTATLVLCVGWTMGTSAWLHEMPISDDVYRYMWDGHVTTSGINPYAHPPNHETLERLAFEPTGRYRLPDDVKYGHMTTIYPPGGQLLFAATTAIGGTTLGGWLLAWQAILIALATALLLAIRRNYRWLAIATLLNPIIIINGLREPHLDVVMALLTVIGVALWERNSPIASGISLAVAMATKYLAGMVVPLLLTARSKVSRTIVVVAVISVALLYAPFLGSNVVGSLGTFASKFQANSLMAALLLGMGMESSTMHMALLACMGLAAGLLLWRYRFSPAYAISVATMAMICLSPVAHPWYLALPVLLFAMAPTRAVVASTLLLPLYLVGWHEYTNGGTWKEGAAVLLAEWLPIMACVVADVVRPPRWPTSEPPSEKH